MIGSFVIDVSWQVQSRCIAPAPIDGGDGRNWRDYLLLWLGFVLGAMAGAELYTIIALGSVWIAAAAAAVLPFAAMRFERTEGGSPGMFHA